MIRKEIETWLVNRKLTKIDLIENPSDEMYSSCRMVGGILMTNLGNRVDRKVNFYGYVSWDGKGNADVVAFDESKSYPRIPFFRNGFSVHYQGKGKNNNW